MVLEVLRQAGIDDITVGQAKKALEQAGLSGQIKECYPLKRGMTNSLFYFSTDEGAYLLRIPGAGSEKLVDRKQEAAVYQLLAGENITDPVIYIDPVSGIKITEYLSEAKVCDIADAEQVRRCMRHLCHFHALQLQTQNRFELFRKIEEYEAVCLHSLEILPDYKRLRERIMALEKEISKIPGEEYLCHIDAVSDNFLLRRGKIHLIDWEYAAVCDPHIDIAMFCIYAGYGKGKIDETIDFYFKNTCDERVRKKIYMYIAACGFLWTIWCEIKKDSGIDYGEYEKQQYDYAKEFLEI
ncbi:MAG: choline/ethanolamine kinase family protein [Acetivibrio ethanolgignens]